MVYSSKAKRRKLIDRNSEQKLFQDLLACRENLRMLAIQDEGGTGKSLLLEHLKMYCLEQEIPVCLIKFQDDFEHKTPILFTQHVVSELSTFDLQFPSFEKMEIARKIGDLNSIYRFSSIEGTINLEGASFEQAANVEISAVRIERQIVHINSLVLRPEHEKDAQDMSINAFLDDLKVICQGRTVVIMIDAYEKCRQKSEVEEGWQKFENWLLKKFLHILFDMKNRPQKLILVIAGRQVPDREDLALSPTKYTEVTITVNALSTWTPKHIIEYFDSIGFTYQPKDVDFFYKMVYEMGYPLLEVIRAIDLYIASQQRKRGS